MMKVLQLGKFYPPHIGGIENTIYAFTEVLNRLGIRCDALCSNSENKYVEEVRENHIVWRTKSYGKLVSTSITPQMIFKLGKIYKNYDIIHIHHPDPMANLALFIVNPADKKIVLHWHSDIIRQKKLLLFYKPLLIWLLKRADLVICTSNSYADASSCIKKFRYKAKVLALPLPNELKVNGNCCVSKGKYKNTFLLFSLGRFVYYKGFEYLIRSLKYIRIKVKLLLGGGGPEENSLKSLTKRLNVNVEFLGNIPSDKLGYYYNICDIFCLPSVERTEAFGLVLLEAMSFAKPIVSGDVKGSGISWVNLNGFSGLTVPVKNDFAIARAIEFLLTNRAVARKMGLNGFNRYRKLFFPENVVVRLIDLYKNLLNNSD